ncbi:MAG: S8 family peptidase, partial [Lachnospiraceae bacterium]|nr:S8 family peptidase [Lachnospiraceae bacterium]
TSLLEQYINSVVGVGKDTIVIGTGNEGAAAGHYKGVIENNNTKAVAMAVGEFEPSLNLQLWKNYGDEFMIEIVTPGGRSTGVLGITGISESYSLGDTTLLVYYGEPTPFSTAQEIYIDFIPKDTYIESGIYQILLTPVKIVVGEFDMWLPVEGAVNDTRFLNPEPEVTITSPATSLTAISVGAYDAYLNAYADFSGRGFLRENNLVKPDIVAPGVNIRAATAYGTDLFSGTSFATPVVSGAVALLMEWGIVQGNDLYMYGEKVKAYLIRGARQLKGEETPSKRTGWGALCLADSIPD